MLDWMKKLGGSKRFGNTVGLGEKAVSLLAADFAPLDELASGLSTRLMRYVLDGEGAEALAELAGLTNAHEKLRLACTYQYFGREKKNPRAEFFQSLESAPAEFFRRLGRVYEAATAQARRHLSGGLGDPKLEWLEILLTEATQYAFNVYPRRSSPCPAITAELLESLIEMEGLPRALLVQAAFQPEVRRFAGASLDPVFLGLPDLAQSAIRHRQTLLAILDHADFKQRVCALTMMKKSRVPPAEFLDKLVERALDSSKQVREEAAAVLAEAKDAARPLVERKIVEGTNDEKPHAVALLWALDGGQARPFLESRLAQEKNKKVLRAIEDTLVVVKTATTPAAAPAIELPPLAPMSSHAPLGAETERAWQECFQEVNVAIAKHNAAQAGQRHARIAKPVSADAIRKSFQRMQDGGKDEVILGDFSHEVWNREVLAPVKEFWQRPELSLVHLVRFLIQLSAVGSRRDDDRYFLYSQWMQALFPVFHRSHEGTGLRELAAAFTAAGRDPRRLGKAILYSTFETGSPLSLTDEELWPYWAENLDLLEQGFAPPSGDYMERYHQRHARQNAFHALATFPHPPERLLPLLWNAALGPKSEREPAQRCLEAVANKIERLIEALGSGSAESRIAAAEWLGRLGDKRAIEPLLVAMKRSNNEAATSAIMSALEALGVPVEQFLDRAALLDQAEKLAAKEVPAGLQWFPFDQLPVVHWSDNEKPVEPAILKRWLLQGFKLKNPEPGPLLRKYCASLKPGEREALGQFVLEAWMAEDTAPITRAEAEKKAMQQAQQYVQWSQSSYWPASSPNKTLEQFYADFLPGLLMQPRGSAVASKGILSVAGACAGGAAAPAVSRFLKQWYGMRAAQCRALLQMLAWVEHKTATQLLLAVGTRFRTKGIQEEATKQVQALAERKGWTVAELADRTIPTAGLDDEGVLTLDFGPRQFAARLTEDLEFALFDPEGKPLKSLPDPRKDDDEAKAAEAKKSFSAAKKELKSVVTMQRDRLYEAMCTQRTWLFEDWSMYLNRHPIARHHCQRLVWAVVRDGKPAALFRPLPDGSLTDPNDDAVTLEATGLVRVAHECQVTPEQSRQWRQHLKDYEVEPLFEQFGRPNFSLTEERQQQDELADFRGHILEAFKLRGRANKLGYTRGQAQDGGWFFDYHKRFPTLGMEAVLEFTGNGLPEENRTVALTTLHFMRTASEGEAAMAGAKMALGEVPAVLLSECWNDIRQMAAEGPGFDPDWEKKTQM